MSYRTAIYQRLAQDPELNGMLARSTVPGSESAPAIYETWAASGTAMPYINLTYQESSGATFFKRSATLSVDIFIDSGDTTQIEAIKTRVEQLLDISHQDNARKLESEIHYPINVYFDTHLEQFEDQDNIHHWTEQFNVQYWNKSLITP